MCTHLRRITNKYTGENMFVKCGHCKACLQEKANRRKSRIEAEYCEDYVPLFVTLTYDRMSCPYVYLQDILDKKDKLVLYRAHSTRYVPFKSADGSVKQVSRRIYKEEKLAEYIRPDYSQIHRKKFQCLRKFGARVGICYYEDLKNFIKRLRINLQRNYNYVYPIKFYSCSEYGPSSGRPHFHLLIFVHRHNEQIVRDAICKSWPFANIYRTKKYIQIAREAAAYVASYVNCFTHLHPFLSQNFKCKHSYSKYFGFGNDIFSLDSVLEMFRNKDMSYFVKYSGEEQRLSPISLPKYVINRYFPLFKGFGSLSDTQILQFIRCTSSYVSLTYKGSSCFTSLTRLQRMHDTTKYCCEPYIEYTPEDLHKISVRLSNAYKYYHEVTGKGIFDYALDFIGVWQCWKSTCFRLWRTDDNVLDIYKFDNVIDLFTGVIDVPWYIDYYKSILSRGAYFSLSPNNFPQNVAKDKSFSDLFDLKDKSRKLTNFVMVECNHYV